MTDNEKLIDAAESMTVDEIHQHPMAALDKLRALARELRAAEKEHTPSDDEREALVAILEARRRMVEALIAFTPEPRPEPSSEVPEPSAEVTHRGTFGHVWPCPLFYVGNWKRVENGHEPVRECTNTAACGSPEPQGEPSDALPLWERPEAIEAARLAYQEAFEANYDAEDCITAALRAAGAVR